MIYKQEEYTKARFLDPDLVPFISVAQANALSPYSIRTRFDEKYILSGGAIVTYWYMLGIEDEDLVPKSPDIIFSDEGNVLATYVDGAWKLDLDWSGEIIVNDTSGTPGQILYSNGEGESTYWGDASVGTTYSFVNGLTEGEGVVVLGGTLLDDTTIEGNGHAMSFLSLLSLEAKTNNFVWTPNSSYNDIFVDGGGIQLKTAIVDGALAPVEMALVDIYTTDGVNAEINFRILDSSNSQVSRVLIRKDEVAFLNSGLTVVIPTDAASITQRFLPISVNGEYAGDDGNITISTGTTLTTVDTPSVTLIYDTDLQADVNLVPLSNNAIREFPNGLFTPNIINRGVIYGGLLTWISGYTYNVSECGYYINGTFYVSPATQVTLSPADGTFDRIDTFTVNTSSVVEVLEGAPSVSPQEPSVDITSNLRLTIVLVQAGTTEPSTISDYVYDENVEWTTSSNSGRIVATATSSPTHGTKNVEATATINNDFVSFATAATPIRSTYTTLSFRIKAKNGFAKKKFLNLKFTLSGVLAGNIVKLENGAYGFDTSNTTTYQTIAIPLDHFGFSTLSNIDKFTITTSANGASSFGYYIDEIVLQGIEQVPTTITPTGRFGIEDALGIQNRVVDMKQFEFGLFNSNGYFLEAANSDYTIYSGIASDYVGTTINYVNTNNSPNDNNLLKITQDGSAIGQTNANGISSINLKDGYIVVHRAGVATPPSLTTDDYYMPLSVNGEVADQNGNILLVGATAARFGYPTEDILGEAARAINMEDFGFDITNSNYLDISTTGGTASLGLYGSLGYVYSTDPAEPLISSVVGADSRSSDNFAYVRSDDELADRTFLKVKPLSFTIEHTTLGVNADNYILPLKATTDNTTYYLPLSVNGNLADSTGNITIAGGGGSFTFENGLTESSGVVKMGGTFTEYTQIDGATHTDRFLITTPTGFAEATFTGVSTDGGIGVYGLANSGNGTGVSGTGSGSGTGVYGYNPSSGNGVGGESETGSAIYGINYEASSSTLYLKKAPTSGANTVISMVKLERSTNSEIPDDGIGLSIDMWNATNFGGDDWSHKLSNQIISKFIEADDGVQTSEFSITGVNSGTTNILFTLSGDGKGKLDQYGSGTITGTPTYGAAFDASGNIIEVALGGGGSTKFGKSGEDDTAGENRVFSLGSTHTMDISGSLDNIVLFEVNATGANAGGIGGYAIGGVGVAGYAGGTGQGIDGTSVDGIGVVAASTSTTALSAQSESGNSATLSVYPSSTNTIVENVIISRSSLGTAANGIGEQLSFKIQTTTGVSQFSNGIISKWTDATNATRTSEFSVTGVNSAATNTLLSISGAGIFTIVQGLSNYANDAAAAAGSPVIPVNGLYRNGSVVMIRVS